MKNNIKILSILFAIFIAPSIANAQLGAEPTCATLGYNDTAANCNTQKRAILKCPSDTSKVYCGSVIDACASVTATTCYGDYICGSYYPDCPSKCKECICSPYLPAPVFNNDLTGFGSYNSFCINKFSLTKLCKYGYQALAGCDQTKFPERYRCCTAKDPSNMCQKHADGCVQYLTEIGSETDMTSNSCMIDAAICDNGMSWGN